jgi:hypothetical protein
MGMIDALTAAMVQEDEAGRRIFCLRTPLTKPRCAYVTDAEERSLRRSYTAGFFFFLFLVLALAQVLPAGLVLLTVAAGGLLLVALLRHWTARLPPAPPPPPLARREVLLRQARATGRGWLWVQVGVFTMLAVAGFLTDASEAGWVRPAGIAIGVGLAASSAYLLHLLARSGASR